MYMLPTAVVDTCTCTDLSLLVIHLKELRGKERVVSALAV